MKDKRTNLPFRAGVASGMLAAVFSFGDVSAQDAGALEEIIVTAQKRRQNLQDVPVSVATISGENLNSVLSGGTDILALSARVPSLYANSSNGRLAPRFFIRGLGNTAFDANAAQPVSLVYDDIVLENVSAKAFPLFDIGSVEVLRGPQGTLFGRNTPAGVVKFESRRPTEEPEGHIDVAYGKYGTRKAEVAIGGALSSNLSARASLYHGGRDHWIDNIAVGYEEPDAIGGYGEFAARVQLHWTPADATRVLLNAGYHNQYEGSTTIFRAGVIRLGGGIIRRDRTEVALDSISRVASELKQAYGTVRVDHDFGGLTLTSISGYRTIIDNANQGDVDGGSLTGPIFPGNVPFLRDVLGFGDNWALETGDAIGDHSQFSQEVRLASNDRERLSWLAGVYYFSEDIRIDQVALSSFPLFGAPPLGIPPLTTQQFQDTSAWALFGSIDYDLTDRTLLKAGLRYSDDDKQHRAHYTAENGDAPDGSAGGAPFLTNVSDGALTGDLSLFHAIDENVNVYARASTGFKAPSVLARDSVPDVGDSEKIWSVEGGIKSEWFARRLRLNLAAFYYEIDDHQIAVTGGVANTIALINVENAIGTGFEADLEFAPHENVLITAGLSLNDTEVDDPTLGIRRPGSGTVLNAQHPTIGNQVLIDGSTLPGPRWIGSATMRLSQPAFGGEAYFLTDWAYRGENPGLLITVEKTSEALLEGGIRFGYVSGDGSWEASVFGRNITDAHELTGALSFFNYDDTTMTGFVNDPRTWGAQFKYSF